MIVTKETHIYDVANLIEENSIANIEENGVSDQVAYIMKSILVKDGRDTNDIPLDEWLEYVDDAYEYSALCRDVLWNLDSQSHNNL